MNLVSRFVVASALAIFVFTTSVSATMYTSAGGPIPDNMPGSPLVIPFAVTDLGTVTSVDLTMTDLTHTWVGDLTATLSGPGGTATILNRSTDTASCFSTLGDNSNFNGTYRFIDGGADLATALTAAMGSDDDVPPGDYAASDRTLFTTCTMSVPTRFATTFNGTTAAGAWSLTISDSASGDSGGLTSATLNVTAMVPEPSSVIAVLMGLASLAFARRS